MARILLKKPKEGRKKGVLEGVRKYYVSEVSKDFHCNDGSIAKEDLQKPSGTEVRTNKGVAFVVFDAQFSDEFDKITRGPQMPLRKDIGLIIAECGLNKNSVVVEAGSGSGGLACYLATVCKKVTSYEIKHAHHAIAKKNKERLGLKNLTLKQGDITEGAKEKEVDCLALDLPNPWDAVETANHIIKPGGYVVAYTPTITQAEQFVVEARKQGLVVLKTSYLMEQRWEINERRIRPLSGSILHSAFLTFARKIQCTHV